MAVPWAMIAKQVSGHVGAGVRGIFNYVSAKRQLESAKTMQREGAIAGLIDMTLERQRQNAGVRAMRYTLGRIDEMYGASDDPKAQRSRRIIREMVGAAGQESAEPRAEQATRSLGARRLALRRAAALGPGGSALASRQRQATRAKIGQDLDVRTARERAEYAREQGFEQERIAAREGGRGLGDITADIRMPYEQIHRAASFDAARKQTSAKWGPSIAAGVQSGIENLISSYLETQARNQSNDYQTPQWVEQEVGVRLDPRQDLLEEDGSLRDMGPLVPEGE